MKNPSINDLELVITSALRLASSEYDKFAVIAAEYPDRRLYEQFYKQAWGAKVLADAIDDNGLYTVVGAANQR